MFKVGDYIIYGTSGVCQVESIGKLNLSDDNKEYYTLTPVYAKASTVYTPVDNTRVAMRRVMSKDEANSFIESIDETDIILVSDEKRREDAYKQALRTGEQLHTAKMPKIAWIKNKQLNK